MAINKNTPGQVIDIDILDSSFDPLTGVTLNTIIAFISLDEGSFNIISSPNPSSEPTPGTYRWDLTQAETDANLIVSYAAIASTVTGGTPTVEATIVSEFDNKIIIYYNINTNRIYDQNGVAFGSTLKASMSYLNKTTVEVHYITATNAGSPDTWPAWTDMANVTLDPSEWAVDDNFLHLQEGALAEDLSGAITSIEVSDLTEDDADIDLTGNIRLDNGTDTPEVIAYTARANDGGGVWTFTVSDTLVAAYLIGDLVEVPDSFLVSPDTITANDASKATGVFSANIEAVSNKLNELLLTTGTTSITGTIEHKIINDSQETIRSFRFQFIIDNLINIDTF